MILESMAEAYTGQINRVAIGGLSLGYGVPKERLTEIVDYCVSVGIFEESQAGAIISPRMKQHLSIREALQEAGRIGARKRWSTSQENRVANGVPNGKGEGKGEGKEKKPQWDEILRYVKKFDSVTNPDAWFASLQKKANQESIKLAWRDWKKGTGITSPSDFYNRCIHYSQLKTKKSITTISS